MSRSRVPRPEHDHVRLDPDAEPLELPFERPTSAITPRHPQNTVTDLPLPHGGNGGSHGAHDPRALLAEALTVVPPPPVERLDTDAVLAWVEAASAGLVRRRQRLWLAHKVERVLWDEWRTAAAVARKRVAIEYRGEIRQARLDGTYWAQREQNRVARRVIHVEVDRDAWREVRAGLRSRRISAGVGLGRMLAHEAQRVHRDGEPPLVETRSSSPAGGRRANLTTRAAIDGEAWATFLAVATRAGTTVARYVGLTIEAAIQRSSG